MARVTALYKLLAIALLTLIGCSDSSDNSRSQVHLTQLTAMEAVQAMKAGDFTPSQYAEALLERAEQLGHLNAFVYLNPDEVREAAREATEKLESGEPLGALFGLPLLVKDSIDTAGIPTTGGTPSLVHNIPAANAPVLQALLDEGAYVFGKTNLAEMSADPLGRNDFFGIALNPYDTSRTPGGTSSGTAVALSARIAPLGLGEDTAGSIRNPAAMTGIIGFRPSSDRYPKAGVVPLAPHRDTTGPMARTVADVALLDSIVTGSTLDLPSVDLQGLRLGLLPSYWRNVGPPLDMVLAQALARLEEHGVVLVREDIPELSGLTSDNFAADMFCTEFDAINAYLKEHDLGFDFYHVLENIVTPSISQLLSLALPGVFTQETCERSLFETRPRVQALLEEYFLQHDVDATVAPTLLFVAPPIGEQTVVIDGEEQDAVIWSLATLEPSSYAGLPSLSIPVGLTEDEQLPVGMIIDGPAGEDRKVLAIGKAIEGVLPKLPPPEND